MTVQLGGRIVAGVFSESSGEWSRDKASVLMFLDSGQYEMESINLEKNKTDRGLIF